MPFPLLCYIGDWRWADVGLAKAPHSTLFELWPSATEAGPLLLQDTT